MADRTAELTALEMAYAKDPTSLAFVPLCSAYLAQNRFMEAMVVCKKGLRNHPDHLEGRLLLARVYGGQAKLQKALFEVEAALAQHPDAEAAHLLRGDLLDGMDRGEEAIAAWRQVLARAPAHEAAIARLRAKGIDQAPPAPDPSPASAPGHATPEFHGSPETHEPSASHSPRGAPGAPAARSASERPTGPGAPPREAATGAAGPALDASAYLGGYDPVAEHRLRAKGPGFGFTFGLFTLLLGVTVALLFVLREHKARQDEITALLKDAQAAHAQDTTASLREAAAGYEAVLKLDEEHPGALPRLAHTYALLHHERGVRAVSAEAESVLARAERVAPDHPATVAARMLQQVARQQYAPALAELNRYRQTLPEGAKLPALVRVVEGEAYRRSGQLDRLSALLEELRRVSTHPGHLTFLGTAYRHLGDRLRAREALELAIRAQPDHDPARAQRALLLLEWKDLSNLAFALDDVTRLQDLGKAALGERQYGYAVLARGEIERLSGREAEFERDLKLAQEQLGPDPDLLYLQAKAWAEEEQEAKAVDALLEAVRLDPHRLRPWKSLIRYAAEAKRLDDADQAVQDAERLFGKNTDLALARVWVMARKGNLDDAQRMLEEWLQEDDDAEVQFMLGRVMWYRGNEAGALDALRLAAERSRNKPTLVQAQIFTLLGRVLAKMRDHGDAVESYRQAIQASGKYADAYYWLGISLAEQRRTDAAREAFETLLKLEPSGKRAKAARQKLDALD